MGGRNGVEPLYFSRCSYYKKGVVSHIIPRVGNLVLVLTAETPLSLKNGCSERVKAMDNLIYSVYCINQAGCVLDARNVFDKMPERNWVTWTAIIAVYSQKGYSNEALGVFREMQRAGRKPDQFTFGSVLRACSELAVVDTGEQVHAHVVKSGFEGDIYAGSALVDMYLKCGIMDDARKVFDRMQKKDVVSWTALITGYSRNQFGLKALNAFCQMQSTGVKGNEYTFASVIGVCSNLAALDQGKEVHAHIIKNGFESEVCVGSVLIDMYGKCGHMDDALKLFEKMSEKDMISWTAVIGGYAQNDFSEEAMKLFCQMLQTGMKANQFTFANVLMSCARLSVLEQGKQFHSHILKMNLESDVFVGSALVDMYAKCGSIGDARNVFDKVVAPNIVSWNSMISGYAQHGHSKEALALCAQMQEEGTKPDGITFIAVLSACSHVGKLDDGLRYFDLMSEQYGISPRMEHYACIVDLLGRAGKLDEAEMLINAMPSVPSSVVWQSLLGCCRIHNYTELGIWAAKSLIDLEPHNSATYVSLSNIYAAAGMWEEVETVRQLMKDRGLKKEPGHSWIEIKNKVHLFVAGDRSHLQVLCELMPSWRK